MVKNNIIDLSGFIAGKYKSFAKCIICEGFISRKIEVLTN